MWVFTWFLFRMPLLFLSTDCKKKEQKNILFEGGSNVPFWGGLPLDDVLVLCCYRFLLMVLLMLFSLGALVRELWPFVPWKVTQVCFKGPVSV